MADKRLLLESGIIQTWMGHQRKQPRGRILHPLETWKQSLDLEQTLLEVIWVDSESDDQWQPVSSFKPRIDKLQVSTVGYLIDDNDTNLVIARSITGETPPLLEGVFSIPKCSIIKIIRK